MRKSTFRFAAVALVGALALTGCATTPDAPRETLTPGPEVPTATGLQILLTQIPAGAETTPYIEYGDAERIAEKIAADEEWALLEGFGWWSLAAQRTVLTEQYAVDASAVTAALSVGQPPATITVLVGPQDAAAVGGAFEAAGWADDGGVLTIGQGASLTVPLALQAPHVVAAEDRLVFGGISADLAALSGDTGTGLMGDDFVATLTGCLGDPIAAMFDTAASVAVGLTESGDAIACYDADTTDAETVEAAWADLPAQLADRFGEASVSSDGGAVSVVVPVLKTPTAIFNAVVQRQLPGAG